MELFFIRRAIAEDAEVDPCRGIRRFQETVEGLVALEVRSDHVLHSPKLRGVQTAELLTPVLRGPLTQTPLLAISGAAAAAGAVHRRHVHGGRPRAAAASAHQAVRDSVRTLDEALAPLRKRAAIGAVHEARAAARRVGDTLSTFAVELPVLHEQAALLKNALGDVRDLHVSGVRRGPRLVPATKAMRQAISDWQRVHPMVDYELKRLVATRSPQKLLRRRLRRLEHRIDQLPPHAPARQAHRLRVKAKRAQTAVQLVAPSQTLLIRRLKKASRLLGQLHDLDAGLEAHASRKQLVHAVTPELHKLRDALP